MARIAHHAGRLWGSFQVAWFARFPSHFSILASHAPLPPPKISTEQTQVCGLRVIHTVVIALPVVFIQAICGKICPDPTTFNSLVSCSVLIGTVFTWALSVHNKRLPFVSVSQVTLQQYTHKYEPFYPFRHNMHERTRKINNAAAAAAAAACCMDGWLYVCACMLYANHVD